MLNNKVIITTDSGSRVEAIAPVILSASRSTDIPAFYANWFFNRLHQGYCVWYNPFNQKPSYVSFERCKVVVFWTKNPAPIIPLLGELDRRGIHYYFQVTLNDYVNEGFEPNVPSVEERVKTFRELASRIGKERVIWRFDPLIVTQQLSPQELLKKIWRIGNMLKGCTEKLVFSFVDVSAYRKVQTNLVKETICFSPDNVASAELSAGQRLEIIEGLVKMRGAWAEEGWKVEMATCGEDFDYSAYGISRNCCIDSVLMERVFGSDKSLVYYLRTGKVAEPDLFGGFPGIPEGAKDLKDKGQRKACGCMVSKDIGMYNTCKHFCVYCYANTSKECVMRNVARHNDRSESIIG